VSSPDARPSEDAQPTAAAPRRPVGILTVDDEACLEWAARLAAAFVDGPAGRSAPAGCGRSTGPPGVTALPDAAFRPTRPFSGPLFAAVEAMALAANAAATPISAPSSSCMGLVVPLVRLSPAPAHERLGAAPIVITDHVALTGRGPLAGPWPADRPRTFPSMNAVYAPDLAAAALEACGLRPASSMPPPAPSTPPSAPSSPSSGSSSAAAHECEPADGRSVGVPAIYSRLAVAGVADTGRQTAFETEQARAAGLSVAASHLVAPVVIAAYYGLVVVAVGVPAGP